MTLQTYQVCRQAPQLNKPLKVLKESPLFKKTIHILHIMIHFIKSNDGRIQNKPIYFDTLVQIFVMDPGGLFLHPSSDNPIQALQTFRAYQEAVNEVAIVSITNLQGDIIYANQKFIDISKYSSAELLGKNHRIINSGHHPKEFFRDMWQNIHAGRSWRGEIKNKAKDGSYYWVDTIITPIADKTGTIFQYLSIRNLITGQKEYEARLLDVQQQIIKREKQLQDAQKVAKTGSWYLTIAGENQLEWSDETYHIFETPVGTTMTYARFLEMVHPADREKVDKSWQAALQTGIYHVEHRILTGSGQKWVSERAHFEFDSTSQLKSAVGTVQDITEKKETEDSLLESKNLYKTLFNNSPFALGIVDKSSSRFLVVNETACTVYGYTNEEFLKLSLYDIRVPEEHELLKSQLSGENYSRDRSVRAHKKKNGQVMYIEPSITSMSYKGHDAYLIAIKDITAEIKAEKELQAAEQLRQKDILEAEEKSRSLIGMELHDNVNQLLVAARLYLGRVQVSNDKSSELLSQAVGIVGTALEEIRKLSATLVTPLFSNTFKDSMEDLLGSYDLPGIKLKLNTSFREDTLSQELRINIYRILQELMSNIIKYAAATEIHISLVQQDSSLHLEIADNGKGFDLKEKKKGIGLTNVIRRAAAYGGQISINTAIGQGCKIHIRFNA